MKNYRRWLINLFIVAYLIAITAWASPTVKDQRLLARMAMQLRSWFVQPIEPFMMFSGLWQGWDMFSPNPLSTNFDVEAEITFEDGSKKTWTFLEMQKLGFFERYQKERYRKWRERIRADDNAYAWPDTAKWIARKFNNPKNPPKEISLTRYWTPIPKPAESDWQPMRAKRKHENEYTFFNYDVKTTNGQLSSRP